MDIDAWVKMSAVVGVDGNVVVVGVPNVLAERRAAGRYLTTLEDAVHRVTGIRFEVRIVLRDGRGEDGEQRASGT